MTNKSKGSKKHYSLNGPESSSSDNNVGTVGQIGYSKAGGKGSYKKIAERIKENEKAQGTGENEEFHSSY